MNKYVLENKEVTTLLVNIITVKMLFTYPKSMIENAGNAAWIQCVFVSLITIAIYLIVESLYKAAGMRGLVGLAEAAGGKPLKMATGLILTVILLLHVSITIRSFPETIKLVLLPLTPIRLVLIIFALTVSSGAFFGFNSIARIHSLFMPIVAFVFVAFLLLLIPYMDINNIFPILSKGTLNIFAKGLESVSIYTDVIVLYIMMPFFKNRSQAHKCGLHAIVISAVVCSLIMAAYSLVYPYPASDELLLPLYQMTRLIKMGGFFQRLESVFEFVWSISMMLYASLYLFVICYVWSEAFDIKYSKYLIPPFALILSALAYLPPSVTSLIGIYSASRAISVFILIVIPTVLTVLFKIKNKEEGAS